MNTKQRGKRVERLPIVYANAAGLDVGAREIYACVPPERAEENVRVFGTFTTDLNALADYLAAHQVDTVALESTGVYWIPVFEVLEARGFKVCLVNARHLKGVPGRKSDVQDCQWLQKLHSVGLLTNSFRPDGEMCALRAYLRHRADLLDHRASHIQHMQKAFQQMNIQLPQVLSDITGETGLAIVRAIVTGERDGVKLAHLRNPHCKSSQDTIAKALTGTWKAEHLFTLQQSLEFYDFYTRQIATCDAHIQQHYSLMKPRWEALPEAQEMPLLKRQRKKTSKNSPPPGVEEELIRISGVDIAAVAGIGAGLAQIILSEIGTDMTQWPTEKHFVSWLGLAPHNDISGGKVLRSRLLPVRNRAGQAFRQAATSVGHTTTAFGAFYRRKRAQGGPLHAQVATANKIARTVYHLLKYHVPYQEMGAAEFERQHQERDLKALRKKATRLGFTLVQAQATQGIG